MSKGWRPKERVTGDREWRVIGIIRDIWVDEETFEKYKRSIPVLDLKGTSVILSDKDERRDIESIGSRTFITSVGGKVRNLKNFGISARMGLET